LREAHLEPAIDEALDMQREMGLSPTVGTMSTYVEGEDDAESDGLKLAFQALARRGRRRPGGDYLQGVPGGAQARVTCVSCLHLFSSCPAVHM
jgi:hypothetical protein